MANTSPLVPARIFARKVRVAVMLIGIIKLRMTPTLKSFAKSLDLSLKQAESATKKLKTRIMLSMKFSSKTL